MNTGQMLLSIGAIVLLGTTVITLNRSSLQNGTMLQQTQIGLYAISFATSTIDEASGKAFDENTVNNAVATTASLTTNLGPESGETTNPVSSAKFDDFDDYNGMVRIDTVPGVDIFTTRTKVYYVSDANPDVKVSSPTWFKRMDVMVYGSGVSDTGRRSMGIATGDTIKMSYVFSYYFYR